MEELFSEPKSQEELELGSQQGILPSQVIQRLVDSGKISADPPITSDQIQPASIDLRLGKKAYEVRASFLPGQYTIDKKIRDWFVREVSLETPTKFGPGEVFIVPLVESLALPPNVYGKANPKSTTGRLDIFTRLITERGQEFETVPPGYNGALYLEVVSRTFPIIVRAGLKLTQLRLVLGKSDITDTMLTKLAKKEPLVFDEDDSELDAQIARGLGVSVDLQGHGSTIVAYKAKPDAPPINLENINAYGIGEFWDVIYGPRPNGLILHKNAFYIMASREKVSVPPTYAAEMVPFDPSLGEFRIHYAGFFDPGFGYGVGDIKGTKAVLEIRAHEVQIVLEDRQLVGRLVYHKMAQAPAKVYGPSIGSSYQKQGLALSKQFKQPAFTERNSVLPASPTLTVA